ncbi:MAG: phytanoyl-CoA dioxygenase family protein [Phycisphaeraceae bacterium]
MTVYDPGQAEGHDPQLYVADRTAGGIPDLDAIDDAAIERYRETGYLLIERLWSDEQVEQAREAVSDLIAGRNEQFNGLMYEAAAKQAKVEELTEAQRCDLIRKLFNFVKHEPRLDRLAHDPPLLAAVRRLMNDEPKLYQDMALIKPPRIGREKPWHQDHAYFNVPLEHRIVGVWIALDEVDADNGAMHLIEGGHREPIIHFKQRDWQICDTEMLGRPAVVAPMKPGGALLFDSLLPHGTPTNHSDRRRRALQFHYLGETAPAIEQEQRLAVFGSEGKDVTC